MINRIRYSPDGKFVVTDVGEKALQVWDAWDGRKLRRLDVEMQHIRDFDFSPDGKIIAAVGRFGIQRIIFIDFATGHQLAKSEWEENGDVWRLSFSPDGKTVATSSDWALRLSGVATGEKQLDVSLGRRTRTNRPSIAFSPDAASHLLAFADDGAVSLWDIAINWVWRLNHDQNDSVTCVAFSPDGSRIASAGRHAEIRVWNIRDRRLLRRLTSQALNPRASYIPALTFSPDGTILAATSQTGNLITWEINTGRPSEPFSTCTLAAGPLAFSPDGKTIATSGAGPVLHLWDRTTGKDRLDMPDAHSDRSAALLFLDGSKKLISGSDDRTVRIWDLTETKSGAGHQWAELKHQGWVRCMAVSPDEKTLVTGSSFPGQNALCVWDLTTSERRWTNLSQDHGIYPIAVRFSSRSDSFSAGWSDGSVQSWGVASHRTTSKTSRLKAAENAEANFPGNFAHTGVFSADREKLATLGMHSGVTIRYLSKEHPAVALPHAEALAFSPDGKSVAVARRSALGVDGTISWVDSDSGQERREIVVPKSYVHALAFSPDGQFLAAGTSFGWERGVIHIYRLRDKKEVQTITAPSRPTGGLAFTPDGKRLATGMSDTSILIWDVRLDLK